MNPMICFNEPKEFKRGTYMKYQIAGLAGSKTAAALLILVFLMDIMLLLQRSTT